MEGLGLGVCVPGGLGVGVVYRGYIGDILGIRRDNAKENRSYHLGFI